MVVSHKVVEQIQGNLIAYFRLFADLPGITFVDEAECTWVASRGMPGSIMLRTNVSTETVDQHLEKTLRQIGRESSHIDWFVFPDCRPADLGQRLAAYGQAGGPDGDWKLTGKIGGLGGTWMLADLKTVVDRRVEPTNFRVTWVQNRQLLKEWQEINAKGFGNDDYEVVYEAFARHGFGTAAAARHCIGYVDDVPVTSATLLLAAGIASVYNVSTPPALRRQGFGGAITHAACLEAKRRGYRFAFVWSSPMGKGVYGRLGFEAAEIGMREYEWKKRVNEP